MATARQLSVVGDLLGDGFTASRIARVLASRHLSEADEHVLLQVADEMARRAEHPERHRAGGAARAALQLTATPVLAAARARTANPDLSTIDLANRIAGILRSIARRQPVEDEERELARSVFRMLSRMALTSSSEHLRTRRRDLQFATIRP